MSAGLGALAPYNDELRDLLRRVHAREAGSFDGAAAHLDGRANSEFRRLVPLSDRRAAGTFFTSSLLRARVVSRYKRFIADGGHVIDPACGLGDLLLAAADLIPANLSAEQRAAQARSVLYGRDHHAPLVEAAASRLALWAAVAGTAGHRTGPTGAPVEVGDAFDDDVNWERFGLVLLNPPYAARRLQDPVSWSSGSVTAAAPFTLDILERVRPGTMVAAILPDVLRSGARYGKWRSEVGRLADLDEVDSVGAFDSWTDVDVFVAHLRRRDPARRQHGSGAWQPSPATGAPTLGDFASLAVGDVVPHRDVPAGDERPYLTVQALPAWATTVATEQRIRHLGRLHEPPFVALRRTSAPTRTPGAVRARAAVYAGDGPVAVENHLIVVRPHDASVGTCMQLMELLALSETTEWLDRRLRLRHLTLTALRELPVTGSLARGPEQ